MDRTAAILVQRLGIHAYDFAMQQVELLADAGAHASVSHWRSITRAIEKLLLATTEARVH